VGSSNIDPFSLLLAREANLVVLDQDFAHQLANSLRLTMAQDAPALDPHAWHPDRRPVARLLEWTAYSLVRFAVRVIGNRGRP